MSDPAARRFAAIALVRLGGALLVMGGIVLAIGPSGEPGGAPGGGAGNGGTIAGYACIAAGLAAVFVAPRLLARRWRSPPG